jgi:hypothetical protein
MKDVLSNFARVANLRIFHEVIAELGFCSQFCCLFQDDWNLMKSGKLWICEFRESSIQES